MRRVSLGAATVMLFAAREASAQSQNCARSQHAGLVDLVEGSYEIPLKASATASLKEFTWTIEYSATVYLEVDSKGDTHAKADATLETHGVAPLHDKSESSLRIDTSSSGKLSATWSSPKHMPLDGTLKGSGEATSILGGTGAESNGPETLTFDIDEALCEHAKGTFESKALLSVLDGFRAKGFSTTPPSKTTWVLGEGSKGKQEVDALKAELKDIEAGAGSDAASDAAKLDALLTKINGKSKALQSCLMKFWFESAMNTLQKDLAPKLAALAKASSKGNLTQLDALFEEALVVDRLYVKLGLDVCSEGQRPGFELLQAKVGAALVEAIAAGNVTQILEFDKEFTLLGSVEQSGSSRAWETVTKIVAKEAKKAEGDVQKLLAPMRKTKGGPKPTAVSCGDPTVLQALNVETTASNQLNLMTHGNSTDTAVNDRLFFEASCSK